MEQGGKDGQKLKQGFLPHGTQPQTVSALDSTCAALHNLWDPKLVPFPALTAQEGNQKHGDEPDNTWGGFGLGLLWLRCGQVKAEERRTVGSRPKKTARGIQRPWERVRAEPQEGVRAAASCAPLSQASREEMTRPSVACRVLWGSYSGKWREKEPQILTNEHLHLENCGQLLPPPHPQPHGTGVSNSWKCLYVRILFLYSYVEMGLVISLSSEHTSPNCYCYAHCHDRP